MGAYTVEVAVIGAGQAGLATSYLLKQAGVRHVVLERGAVGQSWRSQRWDVEKLEDPSAVFAAQPQVSGTGGGHTVSLQSLARDGATLLGRASAVGGYTITLGGDLLGCIAFGDEKSRFFKAAVDEWIEAHGIDADPPTADAGEPALPDLEGSDRRRELDLRDAGITSIIWCTGFDADWSWVNADVFDHRGRPIHQGGITGSPGLYFIGHPWLSKRSSGILLGVRDDAGRIVEHLQRHVLPAEDR